MNSLKLIVLLVTATFIYCQNNLILDADFQNYSPTIFCGTGCDFGLYYFTNSWYGQPNKTTNHYQVLTYGSPLKKGLDTNIGGSASQTCQDIVLVPPKTYLLQFQYFVNYFENKTMWVIFMNQTILNATTNLLTPINYSGIFRALIPINKICFFSPQSVNKVKPQLGVIIDNVYLGQNIISQYLTFQLEENWQTNTLILSSNFTVDIIKIDSLNASVVNIDNTSVPIINIRGGLASLLEIVVDISSVTNPSTVEVILSNFWYTSNLGEGVQFFVVQMENKVLNMPNVENLNQDNTDNTDNTDDTNSTNSTQAQQNSGFLQFILQWFQILLKSIRALKIVGLAVLIFRLISFANISILYIFLNIGFLNANLRQAFEEFAVIIIGIGPIEIFYSLITNTENDFPYFRENDSSLIVPDIDTLGSQFSVINLTTNFENCCTEDLIVMIGNCIKIALLWMIAKKIKQSQYLKQLTQKLNLNIFKVSFLLEIISVAPLWMISAVIAIIPTPQKGNENFMQKINLSAFIIFLVIFIFLWFFTHLLLHQKSNKIKNNRNLKKIRKIKKKKFIYEKLQRLQSEQILYYILFGTLIGFQQIILFFCVTTIYQSRLCYSIIKNRQKSGEFITVVIRKLFQTIIHFGFFSLYILTVMNNSQLINEQVLSILSNLISYVVFYSFIAGCCFEVIVIILKLGYQLFRGVIYLLKKCNLISNHQDSSQMENIRKQLANKQKEERNTQLPNQMIKSKTLTKGTIIGSIIASKTLRNQTHNIRLAVIVPRSKFSQQIKDDSFVEEIILASKQSNQNVQICLSANQSNNDPSENYQQSIEPQTNKKKRKNIQLIIRCVGKMVKEQETITQ